MVIDPFAFQIPTRLVWGSPVGEAVPAEVDGFGAHRVLIVTDPGMAATGLPGELGAALEARGAFVRFHSEVSGNPTTDDVAAARGQAEEVGCDVILAIGGGSAIDTAKAAAMLLTNGGDYSSY